ncbi:MAG: hypothetical protein ABL883_07555 [Terricaulis sp.]
MDWVDYKDYFGPDRRRGRNKRLLDRRKDDISTRAPSLRTALRQLRMRVLEAEGAGAEIFIQRVQAVVTLAAIHDEPKAGDMLSRMAIHLMRANGADVREQLYRALDKVQDAIVKEDC